MIGATLQHRYRLEAELGQGGMSTVYRAYDTLLDRPVALKVLSATGLGTEGRARLPYSRWRNERFEQLLESARRMTDPAERMKFYQAADRLLLDEAGVIPLTYERNHVLLKPWDRRFPVSPIKTTYWKDVILEPH